MSERGIAPYGSWRSPISSDVIVRGVVGLKEVVIDGGDVYWLESRPGEGGRNVVVLLTPDGHTEDVTPQPFNARSRVHEYGGGGFTADGGTVYFANFADQKIYYLVPGEEPVPLTSEIDRRYADMVVDRDRRRLIVVREDHAGHEPVNELVGVDLASGEEHVLVSGNDFYSSPRLSPDGRRLVWLTWNHPNMPWDGTELWGCDLGAEGFPENVEQIAGGQDESIFQPEWSPEGTLHFVSDRTGWWNLYRRREGRVEPLCERETEFGLPQWAFGMSTYALVSPGRIVCSYTERGSSNLAILDTESGELEPLETPYSSIACLRADSSGGVVFRGSSPTEAACIVRLDPSTGLHEVLRRSGDLEIDSGYLSVPEPVEYPTEGGRTAHAFFYPPTNRGYSVPDGELPPLLVMSHGGPTAASTTAFDPGIQYWTSRGIAVLDVNYGGSTGYGREYRRHLEGAWGIVDVDDCANGAVYLAERGLVDGERLIITGSSAGGYTTLCALAFRDTFAAGASHFGISDVEALARDTHKFESRYLDSLIGPYPERTDLYLGRSPIHSAERLSCPVIFFQGLEDEVVPPDQAEKMFAALREKGLPVSYVPFEGEQHGFRRAENIKRALDGELYFYSRVLGFRLADPVEPVPIENLWEVGAMGEWRDEWREANRANWDERVPIHVSGEFYDVASFKGGQEHLQPFEIDEVGDVSGKELLHLQCHFGIDTLSWARRGARVTGLDFSGPAVEAARGLASDMGLEATFVHSDVYEAVSATGGVSFDIVYTGRGAIIWLPDIGRWAGVVANLLKPGGFLYLTEFHPFTDIFGDEDLSVEHDYFQDENPRVWDEPGTYADFDAETTYNVTYEWNHTLGDVVSAVSAAGLNVELLHEYDYTMFPRWPILEKSEFDAYRLPEGTPKIPLMYSLRARKA